MNIKEDYFCIPDTCRDQHLPMVPEFAASFKSSDIRGAGIHEVDVPYEIRRVSAPWHIALITLSGNAEYECDGETGVLKSNDIWIGPAEKAYMYKALGRWKFISAALYKTESFAHLEKHFTHKQRTYNLTHLKNSVEAYIAEAALAQNGHSLSARALAEYIGIAITRELQRDDGAKTSRTQNELNELWEKVNESPNQPWRLPDLARRKGVSVRQFQRMMRDHYGITSERMLTRIRMDHARELLVATDLTMAMIGEKVGYQSVYAFSKAFKRFFEVSPGVYRRNI